MFAVTQLFRGCISDPFDSRILCDDNPESCVKCMKSGCNSQPKIQNSKLLCHQCDSTDECAFGQQTGLETKCTKKVPFLSNESCYTLASDDGKVIKRGCTLEYFVNENMCKEDAGCRKCPDEGCNNGNLKYQRCVVCNSNETGDCTKLDDPNMLMKQCDGEPYSHDKRGCYTITIGNWKVSIRQFFYKKKNNLLIQTILIMQGKLSSVAASKICRMTISR